MGAYGSHFNDTFKTNVPVNNVGQKVVFTTIGPLLNVAPAPAAPTTDLQVATNSVYEISMNLEESISDHVLPCTVQEVSLSVHKSQWHMEPVRHP